MWVDIAIAFTYIFLGIFAGLAFGLANYVVILWGQRQHEKLMEKMEELRKEKLKC